MDKASKGDGNRQERDPDGVNSRIDGGILLSVVERKKMRYRRKRLQVADCRL